jgi:hypothetical protein
VERWLKEFDSELDGQFLAAFAEILARTESQGGEGSCQENAS